MLKKDQSLVEIVSWARHKKNLAQVVISSRAKEVSHSGKIKILKFIWMKFQIFHFFIKLCFNLELRPLNKLIFHKLHKVSNLFFCQKT